MPVQLHALLRSIPIVATALLILAAPACVDDDSGCSVRDGCEDPNEICIGPNESSCGIHIEDMCSTDSDCPDDRRCHAINVGCSDDGLATECGAPCEPGDGGGGFRCNADGALEPVPCDEGYTCGALQRCDPSRASADRPLADRTHGCVGISCGVDNPCDDGVCVNGRCQSGPGRCQAPPQGPPPQELTAR